MRLATITFALLALVAPPSLAQPSPCSPHTAGGLAFDPYNPSDLAIARNYGGTVLAQAPLGALFQLDPYVPIEGELLRQLGRGIPVWAYPGYAWYPPVPQPLPCPPVPETMLQPSSSDESPLSTFSEALAALPPRDAPPIAASTRTASPRNQGITIQWDGRTWASAGAAVPFSETEFVRFGKRAESPIFRRAGARDNVIYIHTTPGMVAPFRPAG